MVDCRTMTVGTREQVKKEMDSTLEPAREHCRGFIFAVGDHIPPNVSDDMCDFYIGYLGENWKRE